MPDMANHVIVNGHFSVVSVEEGNDGVVDLTIRNLMVPKDAKAFWAWFERMVSKPPMLPQWKLADALVSTGIVANKQDAMFAARQLHGELYRGRP